MDIPETLDEYIRIAVRIDNRLYDRRQQKRQGKTNATRPTIMHKTLGKDTKKVTPKSTATGTHAGPMDIDAAQKAKTKLVSYNCGKKGHTKKTCKVPEKPWNQFPKMKAE